MHRPPLQMSLHEVFRPATTSLLTSCGVWRATRHGGHLRAGFLHAARWRSNGQGVFRERRLTARPYAVDTPFSTFELYGRGERPNDLAALHGARLVTSSETVEGDTVNEGRIKSLTGGPNHRAIFASEFSH